MTWTAAILVATVLRGPSLPPQGLTNKQKQIFEAILREFQAHKEFAPLKYAYFISSTVSPEIGLSEAEAANRGHRFFEAVASGISSIEAASSDSERSKSFSKCVDACVDRFVADYTPAERKRLFQIELWTLGPGSCADAATGMAKPLGLTKDQLDKVASLNQAFLQAVNDIYDPRGIELDEKGKPTADFQRKALQTAESLYAKYDQEVLASLSTKQRKAWKELRGKKFVIWSEVR